MVWETYKIQWFVDGNLVRTKTKYSTPLRQQLDCHSLSANTIYLIDKAFPDNPMNLIISMGIQSGLNEPEISSAFPLTLEVDYIRYYQKLDCAVDRNYDFNIDPLEDFENTLFYGRNITVTGPIAPAGILTIKGSEEIKLLDGFSVTGEANYFNAQIVSCDLNQRLSSPNYSNLEVNSENIESNPTVQDNSSRVYPNPSSETLNIEFKNHSGYITLTLINSLGSIVLARDLPTSSKAQLGVKSFSEGVYLLQIREQNSKSIENFRVIISK